MSRNHPHLALGHDGEAEIARLGQQRDGLRVFADAFCQAGCFVRRQWSSTLTTSDSDCTGVPSSEVVLSVIVAP